MKKKVIGVILTAVLACGLLAGCGSASNTQKTSASSAGTEGKSTVTASRQAESKRTELKVGFDAQYPPYGYMGKDGEYTGFDLEFAQAVCDMEGWKLVKVPINWNAKDMELNSGNIDCIWNGFTINGREDKYTWSDPYVDNTQVIVVSKSSGITKLSQLSGKTVGVQQASAALDVLQSSDQQKKLADTFKALKQFSDYNVAFTQLQAGSLDAVAMDVGVANYQIKNRGADKYVVLSQTLNSEQYGVGFKLGNTTLRDVVNADMKKLAADGTVAKLAKKYGISNMISLK